MGDATQAEPKRSRAEVRKDAAERRAKALRLRTLRMTYEQIATELGYTNRAAAYRAVQKGLADIPYEAAEELRRVELESLDEMERAVITKALKGDTKALATMLRIKEHRAKLTRLYEEHDDSGLAEVRDALAGFLQLARAGVGE